MILSEDASAEFSVSSRICRPTCASCDGREPSRWFARSRFMVPYLRHPRPKPFFSYRRILPGLLVLGAVSVLSLLSSGGRAYASDEQDALRQEPSPEDAALIRSLEGKIHELQNPQANPHVGPSSMEITEAEVNAYFKHRGSELSHRRDLRCEIFLPAGTRERLGRGELHRVKEDAAGKTRKARSAVGSLERWKESGRWSSA